MPIVFTIVGDRLCTAVDAKPKGGTVLRRLANIAVNPRVSVLVDRYDDDWTQLWWARTDGTAQLRDIDRADVKLLASRYPQYREQPPPGPLIVVTVERWSGWTAGDLGRPTARANPSAPLPGHRRYRRSAADGSPARRMVERSMRCFARAPATRPVCCPGSGAADPSPVRILGFGGTPPPHRLRALYPSAQSSPEV